MAKQKTHRLGVSEVNLVNRHLALQQPIDASAVDVAIQEIDQLYGLDEVRVDAGAKKLHFSYDASRLCIDCLEEIPKKHAIQLRENWWARFKEGHYRFVDQNVKDNARHEPWSCHRTPGHN